MEGPQTRGYQTAINQALREYLASDELEVTLRRVVRGGKSSGCFRTAPKPYWSGLAQKSLLQSNHAPVRTGSRRRDPNPACGN